VTVEQLWGDGAPLGEMEYTQYGSVPRSFLPGRQSTE